jgi:transposase
LRLRRPLSADCCAIACRTTGKRINGRKRHIVTDTFGPMVGLVVTAKGFEVLPRRWVVERTFAWLGRSRRLAKDWEKSIASAEAWIFVAHIRLLTRRLARYCYR